MHGDARPARHGNLARCRRPPACRSRASRSWCRRAAAPRRARCRSRHRRRIGRARRRGGFRSRDGPAGWVCSTMTMASAPRGTGPPVAIEVAVPDNTGRAGAVPQAITSSFSISRTGVASPAAARSAERTAKPSTLERSNGGTSIGATTSSRQRAAERVGELSLLGSAPRAETARLQNAPARPRATGWSGTGPDPCSRGLSAGACWSCRNSIIPATYRHRPARPQQNLRRRPGPRARLRRGRSRRATSRRPPA